MSEAPRDVAASQEGEASLDRVEVTYGCDAASLQDLAGQLAAALSRPLHRQESPRTGPWYSSHDLSSFTRARKSGDVATTSRIEEELRSQPVLVVRRSEVAAPSATEGGAFLLTTTASAEQLADLEGRLRAAGVPFEERSRAPRPPARTPAPGPGPREPRRPERP